MRGVVAPALVLAGALLGCGRLDFDATRGSPDSGAGGDDGGDSSSGARWTRIAAGDETVCGLAGGRAYCWGRGTNNEIGDGNALDRNSPTAVALPAGTVTDIVQGEGHGCAIVDGAAYCWGRSAIGNNTPSSATPAAVTGLPGPVTAITAGGGFACAIAGGGAYCWGDDLNGALGNGAGGPSMTPQQVALPASATGVDAGNDHVMALLGDGRVFVWGHNDNGVFGAAAPAISQLPILMPASMGVQPVVAGWHACALKNGGVTCWGAGTMGELGDNQNTDNPMPVQVMFLSTGVEIVETGGGPSNRDATCATSANIVVCWGNNAYGRLGTGDMMNAAIPKNVQGIPEAVDELALGFETTCSRGTLGTVRCWGRGDLGQLGDGRGVNSMMPVIVPVP